MKRISSRHNPTIKHLRALHASGKRVGAASHEFLVEGVREVLRVTTGSTLPLAPRTEVLTVLLSESRWDALLASGDPEANELAQYLQGEVLVVPDDILALVSVRQNPPPVIAHVRGTLAKFSPELLAQSNVVLVLDSLEKPGNVGALLRSATAAGVDLVVVAHEHGARADVFNPNTIRASTGTVFRAPLVAAPRETVQAALATTEHTVVLTTPHTENDHWHITWPQQSTIVIGKEDTGAHESWFANDVAAVHIRIPMAKNGPDSLNASVAGALVLYEAVRGRLL